jgi:hypothetical protein
VHAIRLMDRCPHCGSGLRMWPFMASFSPALCTRCRRSLLTHRRACIRAHPSVACTQSTLFQGKREGITRVEGLGSLTWKDMVAHTDVLIGMVSTAMTAAQKRRLRTRLRSEVRDRLHRGSPVHDGRHDRLRLLAWLTQGGPTVRVPRSAGTTCSSND